MNLRHCLLTLLLCMCVLPAEAAPALNALYTLSQPDSTVFQARIRGDEHLRIVTDPQGHVLVQGRDKVWYYARYEADGRKVSTGYPVGGDVPAHILAASTFIPEHALRLRTQNRRRQVTALREARPGLLSRVRSVAGPRQTVLNKHSIVILAEFADTKMTYTRDDFVQMLTLRGYDENGATGSAMDYFDAMFQGDYHFEFTVSPVITLDHESGWYFDNDDEDNDKNPGQAVVDACTKAHEAGIDFSRYDDDGDGEVDNVIVFVAGKDEAQGAGASAVWSHAWFVKDGAGITCRLDGKLINSYAITTEIGIDGYTSEGWHFGFTGIGTFCHEFSHTFGLPDFYDVDYAGSGGQADGLFRKLDLMDGGNSNNYGRTPPHYSALDYYLLGLGTCEDLTVGNRTLEPISTARRYLKYETGTEGEYYLFECRDNNTAWDKHIGGKGLLIYHVDRTGNDAGQSDTYEKVLTARERWEYNEVNANPIHECAALMAATPGVHAFTSDGYDSNNQSKVFYPQTSYRSFTPQTTPAFIFWNGKESPVGLVNIATDGSRVSFTVQGFSPIHIPEVGETAQEIFQDAAILQWTATDPAYTGNAYVSWGISATQKRDTVAVAPYEPGRYALRLEGLDSRTAYRTDVWFEQSDISSEIRAMNFTTKAFMSSGVPYIALPPKSGSGSFPSGTQLPLHVNNMQDAAHVEWFLGSTAIAPGGNGYYTLTRSGTLKAVVTRKNGYKDYIIKVLKVQ